MVVVDGYLIGDAVLLRPLIKALMREYSSSHRILLISGYYTRCIDADFINSIEFTELRFPWATYDYSLRSILKLFRILFCLYVIPIDVMIETRGDFRTIALSYLTCPDTLMGFDFTGGRRFLTKVVSDDGTIKHLFKHIEAIGDCIGVKVSIADMIIIEKKQISHSDKIIGVSFCGSLPLKTLKKDTGYEIIRLLLNEKDCKICYVLSQNDKIYTEIELRNNFRDKIGIFKGGFKEYFDFLKQLELYIGMDSAGGHLCSLWGIPSVIIFGTQQSWYCKPVGSHPLLCLETQKELKCRPCAGRQCENTIVQECLNNINIGLIPAFYREHCV